MKQKLIKPSEEHYIVVDDSEIKEGEWVIYLPNNEIYKFEKSNNSKSYEIVNSLKDKYKKITHSTQPLGFLQEKGITTANLKHDWGNVKPLSLSKVEEAINGYSVEKMAIENNSQIQVYKNDTGLAKSVYVCAHKNYIEGFKAHQELSKDKLFTREDLWWAYVRGFQANEEKKEPLTDFNDVVQSLQKTEWECTIDEQGKIKLL